MNPFDVIKAITLTKENLITDDVSEKAYNAFMVNRGLSYFPDTLLYAQEMNLNHHLDNKLQFSYLINTIRKGKRFSKWHKPTKNADFSAVQEYYGYNHKKTEAAMSILSGEQIDAIKQKQEKGGIK